MLDLILNIVSNSGLWDFRKSPRYISGQPAGHPKLPQSETPVGILATDMDHFAHLCTCACMFTGALSCVEWNGNSEPSGWRNAMSDLHWSVQWPSWSAVFTYVLSEVYWGVEHRQITWRRTGLSIMWERVHSVYQWSHRSAKELLRCQLLASERIDECWE